MEKIQPTQARYIKLGRGGKYESACFREGVLRLGHYDVPDIQAATPELITAEVRRHFDALVEEGEDRGNATRFQNEVLDFYLCGEDTVWVTYARGRLWWCIARPGVKYLGGDRDEFRNGSRERQTISGWSDKSIGGRPLVMEELDGRLTKTAGYKSTICGIRGQAFEYLKRVINDESHPDVEKALARRAAVLDSIVALVRSLHPITFELLVDLVFSQSGWRRISPIGGSQKTIDILLELPSTGEKAFVQVKSQTDAPQFEDYVSRLEGRDEDRMFYVYHTGPELSAPGNVTVINAERLAEMILNAGLLDWLIKKSGF